MQKIVPVIAERKYPSKRPLVEGLPVKLLQIFVLLGAGALAGTLVTRVWLRPYRPAQRAEIAPAPARPPVSVPAPAADLPTAVEPPHAASVSPNIPPPPPSPRLVRSVDRKRMPLRPIQPAYKSTPVLFAKTQPELARTPQAVSAPPPVSTSPAPSAGPVAPAEPQITTQPESSPHQLTTPHRVTLNTGLLIRVRLADALSSETSKAGDTFTARIDQEIVVDGFVIVERGAPVEGRVTAVDRGAVQLTVELTRLFTADRQQVPIQTESFERRPENSQPDGAGDPRLTPGAATLPANTRIHFRLRTSVPLTERLG